MGQEQSNQAFDHTQNYLEAKKNILSRVLRKSTWTFPDFYILESKVYQKLKLSKNVNEKNI
jgi:hypothetical protein